MSNEDILKEQIKALEKLIEVKDKTIAELEKFKIVFPQTFQYPYNQPYFITNTPNTITSPNTWYGTIQGGQGSIQGGQLGGSITVTPNIIQGNTSTGYGG